MEGSESSSPDRVEEYIELLTQNEASLKLYIISMIPVLADAEDLLQDTKMTIWKDFHQYESGTHFGAWARRIAYNRILAFRKKKAIEKRKVKFSDDFYEVVDPLFETDQDDVSDKLQQLLGCVKKLQPAHQQALQLRYKQNLSIEEVSSQLNRTVAATYRLVSRIRGALKDCMSYQEQTA